MLFVFIKHYVLAQVIYAAVCTDANIAAFPCVLENLVVFALARANDGGQNLDLCPLRQQHYLVDNLVNSLLLYLLAAFWAVRHADARPQQAQVVVDLRHGADRGARVF